MSKKLKKIDLDKTEHVTVDGSRVIVTEIDFRINGLDRPLIRGKVNAPGAGAIWHGSHWDYFGRYIGSDNEPLDTFHLNLVV